VAAVAVVEPVMAVVEPVQPVAQHQHQQSLELDQEAME
jgi:hypothetical protein